MLSAAFLRANKFRIYGAHLETARQIPICKSASLLTFFTTDLFFHITPTSIISLSVKYLRLILMQKSEVFKIYTH